MKFYLIGFFSAHKTNWPSHSSNHILRQAQDVRFDVSAFAQVCHFVLQLLYLMSLSSHLHACEKTEYRETLTTLSVISASHFAQDPRHLEKLAATSPAFKESQYYKCVATGFSGHPELGKEPSWLRTIAYSTGLTTKLPSTPAYLDAIKIQVECTQKIMAAFNNLDT